MNENNIEGVFMIKTAERSAVFIYERKYNF